MDSSKTNMMECMTTVFMKDKIQPSLNNKNNLDAMEQLILINRRDN